ncbi:MAG: amino acid ABC transporter substrate-binding protein, partial [Actinomycetospora chiangmaiensis]|nr:amino acid ABC transporter substrate-binding protein [Actinomycetospora chiangmaiensis]
MIGKLKAALVGMALAATTAFGAQAATLKVGANIGNVP